MLTVYEIDPMKVRRLQDDGEPLLSPYQSAEVSRKEVSMLDKTLAQLHEDPIVEDW